MKQNELNTHGKVKTDIAETEDMQHECEAKS